MTTAPSTASLPDSPLNGYGVFRIEIKAQIRQRQFQAMRAANHELLALYWWLGWAGRGDENPSSPRNHCASSYYFYSK